VGGDDEQQQSEAHRLVAPARPRPITVRGGTKIATLADARAFMLDPPANIQERSSWQHAVGG
jgi:hypothetical protein